MRIGTYPLKGEGTPEERLRTVKAAGFDFVCVGMTSMLDGTGFSPELCGKVGIDFDNVHLECGGTNAIWSDTEAGEKIAKSLCEQIKTATEYGLHTGIIHVTWGKKDPLEPPNPLGLSRYEKIAECAEKYSFTLAVENSVFPTHLYYVMDAIKSPYVGFCFDSGHQHAYAPGEDFLTKYGDRLVATHIHDNDGAAHDLHICPFDGTRDWQALAKRFAGVKYTQNTLCSEFGSAHTSKMPSKTAEQLDKIMSRLPIYGTDLCRIREGAVDFYAGLTFEAVVDRIYTAMRRLADMVEAERKVLNEA